MTESQNGALDAAKALLVNADEIRTQRQALIDKLRKERADIDAALKALGETPTRQPGRPRGSRNRKQEGQQ